MDAPPISLGVVNLEAEDPGWLATFWAATAGLSPGASTPALAVR